MFATWCLLLRMSVPGSEALGLHEGVEQIGEKTDGAEAGEPGHERCGHGCPLPTDRQIGGRAVMIGARSSTTGPRDWGPDL